MLFITQFKLSFDVEVAEKVWNGISYALNVCKKVDFPNPISPIHTRSPIYTVSLNIVLWIPPNQGKLLNLRVPPISLEFLALTYLNWWVIFFIRFNFDNFFTWHTFRLNIKVKLILHMTHNSRKLFIETYIMGLCARGGN